jgi:glucose/arabinose dehydrogenase
MRFSLLAAILLLSTSATIAGAQIGNSGSSPGQLLTGQNALNTDWHDDIPGLSFYIRLSDLPQPYSTPSSNAGPNVVNKPADAWPKAPAGFVVERVIDGLATPRKLITAPNGDIFLSETGGGQVRIVRQQGSAQPTLNQVFVGDLDAPFGLAFYPPGPNPQYLYVATTETLVRYPYHNGDTKETGPGVTLLRNLSNGGGGHSTRDIVFSADGSKLFLSVGSGSNVMDNPDLVPVEARRARIFEYNPDGTGEKVYASGIRNPVGLAINPLTGALWTSVNERDGLGDNLVPDYITQVQPGGFYGWPWYWMGGNADKRAVGSHPELQSMVITPDVILQPHLASLCMTFYKKGQFPAAYNGDAFACEHGSWNRSRRAGYKVIRVFLKNGKATGVYQDFLTGFVVNAEQVWGRPVGVTEGLDGSLYVTDDGSNTLWHVRYVGKSK